MLTAELTTVYLDTADLTQADIEQGEALLEALDYTVPITTKVGVTLK